MEKTCYMCGGVKSTSAFGVNRSKPDGLQSQCSECKRLLNANWNKQYKDRRKQLTQERKAAIKKLIAGLKNGKRCPCGESDPLCLDFHHKIGEKKLFTLSEAVTNGVSSEKINAEASKCVLICSNCHRKLHGGRELPWLKNLLG